MGKGYAMEAGRDEGLAERHSRQDAEADLQEMVEQDEEDVT